MNHQTQKHDGDKQLNIKHFGHPPFSFPSSGINSLEGGRICLTETQPLHFCLAGPAAGCFSWLCGTFFSFFSLSTPFTSLCLLALLLNAASGTGGIIFVQLKVVVVLRCLAQNLNMVSTGRVCRTKCLPAALSDVLRPSSTTSSSSRVQKTALTPPLLPSSP